MRTPLAADFRREKRKSANREATETALTGDAKKIDAAFKAAEKDRMATRALLPVTNAATYDKLFSALEAAQMKHDTITVSLQAAELQQEKGSDGSGPFSWSEKRARPVRPLFPAQGYRYRYVVGQSRIETAQL